MVTNYQVYVGTSAPISFNGLVRHYDLRSGENVADIQVNLVNKKNRNLQSHEIARQMRPGIQAIAAKGEANAKIVEVPPVHRYCQLLLPKSWSGLSAAGKLAAGVKAFCSKRQMWLMWIDGRETSRSSICR